MYEVMCILPGRSVGNSSVARKMLSNNGYSLAVPALSKHQRNTKPNDSGSGKLLVPLEQINLLCFLTQRL